MSMWVPVALSRDVPAGTTLGTIVQGREIVVWREEGGALHAWEDRCPHRGMRLSRGFVRGDRLGCLYHGWRFDAEGACRLMPAHPDGRIGASARVGTYFCAEAGAVIFVSLDGDDCGLQADASARPLRSMTLLAPVATVRSAIAAGLPDGLVVAVQQVGACETVLHATLAAEHAGLAAEMDFFLRDLRTRTEAGA